MRSLNTLFACCAILSLLYLVGCGSSNEPRASDLLEYLNFTNFESGARFTSAELETYPEEEGRYSVRFSVVLEVQDDFYDTYYPQREELDELVKPGADVLEFRGLDRHSQSFVNAREKSRLGVPPSDSFTTIIPTARKGSEHTVTGAGTAERVVDSWKFEFEREMAFDPRAEGRTRDSFQAPIDWENLEEREIYLEKLRSYNKEIGAFMAMYRDELKQEETRRAAFAKQLNDRRAVILATFEEGTILNGHVANSESGRLDGLSLEVVEVDRANGVITIRSRNDGGWSLSRLGTLRVIMPETLEDDAHVTFVLTRDTAIKGSGPLLSDRELAVDLSMNGGRLAGETRYNRFEFEVLASGDRDAYVESQLEPENRILETFAPGNHFRGTYQSDDALYAHSFLMRVDSFDERDRTLTVMLESMENPGWTRKMSGKINPHLFQSGGMPVRLASGRELAVSGSRDRPFSSKDLEWGLAEEGAFWKADLYKYSVQMEPVDAEWIANYRAERQQITDQFIAATSPGAQLRGVWVQASNDRGYPIVWHVLRSEQGGRLFQVEVVSGDDPTERSTFAGSVDIDERTLSVSQERNSRGVSLPLINLGGGSIDLRFNHSDGSFEGTSRRRSGNLRMEPALAFNGAHRSPVDQADQGDIGRMEEIGTTSETAFHADASPSTRALSDISASPSPSAAGPLPSEEGAFVAIDGVWMPVDPVPVSVKPNLLSSLNPAIGAVLAGFSVEADPVSATVGEDGLFFYFRGSWLKAEELDPALELPHLARLESGRKDTWEMDLHRLAPGLAGVLPENRVPINLKLVGDDGYLLKPSRPLASGCYVIFIGQAAYTINVH